MIRKKISRSASLVVHCALFYFLAHCNKIVVMPEKVVTPPLPSPPAIHVDRFLHEVPNGKIDVLIVVDNTETIEPGLSYIEESYVQFLNLWSSSEVSQIDYRIQMISTPMARTPNSYAGPTENIAEHLGELFDPPGGSTGPNYPIFTQDTSYDHREHGYPVPFFSTVQGLQHPAFSGRAYSPLFLVHLLGDDMDPYGTTQEQMAEYYKTFLSLRHLHHTYQYSIVRGTHKPHFPYCAEFRFTPTFFSALAQIAWAGNETFDLCHKKWENWENEVFEDIVNFRRRKVLTHVPYLPLSMKVRGGARTFRQGDDYIWHASTNEIVFTAKAGLEPGDLIEASYFIKPPDPEVSGSDTPPGIPADPPNG